MHEIDVVPTPSSKHVDNRLSLRESSATFAERKATFRSMFVMGFCALTAFADELPRIVPISGKPVPARLMSIRNGQATFLGEDNRERPLALSKVVRWGHLQDPADDNQVLLSDGSILIGNVTEVSRGRIVIETDVWGELTLPRRNVRGIVWHLPTDQADQWMLRDSISDKVQRDLLTLKNGDVLKGRLVSGDRDQLRFESTAGEIELNVDMVRAWQSSGASLVKGEGTTIIGLLDGAQLVVSDVRLDDRLHAVLACGVTLGSLSEIRPVAERLVSFIQPSNESVVYLSDMRPLGYKHIPFLNTQWDWKPDRNVLGGPISCGQHLHAKGIGMHSTSRLAFDLPGSYNEFQSEVCIDRSSEQRGSVVFRVFTSSDGSEWHESFKTGTVRGGTDPVDVRVDVRAARRIALVVDFADRGDVLDRANWIGARLVKRQK